VNALRGAGAVAVAVVFAGCVACQREGDRAARTAPSPSALPTVPLALRTLPPKIDDTQLAVRVKTALVTQVGIDAFHVAVRARRGTVTLEGAAPSATVAREETETAREIPGVERLVNHIRVAP